ncbi:hypothetical protein [Halanaerobaculum tunisiense]
MTQEDPQTSPEEKETNQQLENQKTKEILNKVDAQEKNERLKDPKQATPDARSDLPKS